MVIDISTGNDIEKDFFRIKFHGNVIEIHVYAKRTV